MRSDRKKQLPARPATTSIDVVRTLRRELALCDDPKKLATGERKLEKLQRLAREEGAALGIAKEIVKARAETLRRIGKVGELRTRGGDRKSKVRTGPLMWTDIGISKRKADVCRTLADWPTKHFDAWLAELDTNDEDSVADGYRRAHAFRNQSHVADIRLVGGCTIADLHTLIERGDTFGTIYADPPWQYGNQATRASTSRHYETMTVDAITALPIAELAATNAHLHLWTTNAFLFDAQRIIEAWGFTYKSCFVWVKKKMGIGNYWRVSHEFLLLGVRGRCEFGAHDEMSWREFPRGKHSEKPDQVREMIERVSPAPRLELFGRRACKGWTVWGNEIERTLLTDVG